MSRLARISLAGVLLSACWLTASPALAQSDPPPWGHGTHAFRLVLHNLGFQPLQSFNDCFAEPEKTIVIVLGETASLDRFPAGVDSFVEKGGALLAATDRGRSNRQAFLPGNWEAPFGVLIREGPILVLDGAGYRGSMECPVIAPSKDSPLLRGVRQGVASNKPGYLHVRRSASGASLSILARYPNSSFSMDGTLIEPLNTPIFAAGHPDWGKGRVLILADHSVFINDMMLQSDNDNIPFAYHCLEYLREEKGKRTRVLFVEEGNINAQFNIPVIEPPLPPPGPWIDHMIQSLEQDDFFNQTLLDHVTMKQLLRGVAAALTVLLMLYGLMRLVRARQRTDPAAPLAVVVNRQLALREVLHQRHQDMLRADNLWEAARALAQECLAPLRTSNEPHPPPLRSTGGWWRRWSLRRKVDRLWQLAFGVKPIRVSAQEFVHLVREMNEIRTAMAQGTLAIGP